jgi:hypothetical protein
MSTTFPATAHKTSHASTDAANRRLEQELRDRILYYRQMPEQIEQRLEELDREWDMERLLEANASSLALTGTLLGAFVHRGFLVLPAIVATFLLQHALQGWCPPLPIFRHYGVRSAHEIEQERHALKLIRGDYGEAWSDRRVEEILAAVS